jgi:hypothetical protein
LLAESNLLKAEALLAELALRVNNLKRSRDKAQKNCPDSESANDKQSIFSRISRSSNLTSSATRQRLKMLIMADRIDIWNFLTQARSLIKHQKRFIRQAVGRGTNADDAERWFDQSSATCDTNDRLIVGSRQIQYLARPNPNGTALLCQTKVYKNEMRAQDARLMYVEKAVKAILV